MGFNGKSLILVGAILFIFQISNFFSIETITPELERAQVLAAVASLIIILKPLISISIQFFFNTKNLFIKFRIVIIKSLTKNCVI